MSESTSLTTLVLNPRDLSDTISENGHLRCIRNTMHILPYKNQTAHVSDHSICTESEYWHGLGILQMIFRAPTGLELKSCQSCFLGFTSRNRKRRLQKTFRVESKRQANKHIAKKNIRVSKISIIECDKMSIYIHRSFL